ncbi:MAG: DNA-processing protein DprA [Erysipelotrichaceae bacterium]|nr:DNA-processing protein DprA [Erysipelotrichaceae bacterium]
MRLELNLDSIALLLYCSDVIETNMCLTNVEWLSVEKTLKAETRKTPSRLLNISEDTLVNIYQFDEHITQKILYRLSLLNELLYALSHLENMGIMITTIYEDNYPRILQTKLKKNIPFYIYYVGHISLINKPMISILGLQNIGKKQYSFVKNFVSKIHNENYTLITNDSKGTEVYALKTMMRLGGQAICCLNCHLYDKKKIYSKYIKNNQLLLISAINPYSDFNVTNALYCNSYISCLSDIQLISSVQANSGAVWFTAMQVLHYKWSKLLVLNDFMYSGNIKLLEMGAIPISYNDVKSKLSIIELIDKNNTVKEEDRIQVEQLSIFELMDQKYV